MKASLAVTGVSNAFKLPVMSFGKWLREARKRAGKTQDEIAALFGISRASVAQWESDETMPEADKLARIADELGVSLNVLMTGRPFQGVEAEVAGYAKAMPLPRAVPLVSWVQAGRREPVADPYASGEGEKYVYTTQRVGENAYALRIRGDSMEPRFQDGDIVIIDPALSAASGKFVVVRFEQAQEATFKQLVIDADRQYLKPLNARYPIIPIDEQAVFCGTWVQTIVDAG